MVQKPDAPDGISTDDRKLAYAEIGNHLRAGVVTLWDAFKTYFTITALLFAGCGFLLSSVSPFGAQASTWVSLLVCLGGILITVLAVGGMVRILAYQKAFIERGQALEKPMGTGVYDAASRIWGSVTWSGSDRLTYLVFGIFGVAWFVLGVICVGCLVDKTYCPAPVCK